MWSTNEIDLSDPFQRKWYIQQVLTHGRAEDGAALDGNEIRELPPQIELPIHIKSLWERYYSTAA